jgi:hypothetical protein
MNLRHAALAMLCLAACSRDPGGPATTAAPAAPNPPPAAQAIDPPESAASAASAPAAPAAEAPETTADATAAIPEPVPPPVNLVDPARGADRESARAAVQAVPGVRSAGWLDRENLLVAVDRKDALGDDTIDAICQAIAPFGDTRGVVVNLRSGVASEGDGVEIVARNCQLASDKSASLQGDRQDKPDPAAIRAQEKDARALEVDAAQHADEQAESVKVLEGSTPEMQAPVKR